MHQKYKKAGSEWEDYVIKNINKYLPLAPFNKSYLYGDTETREFRLK